uniref:Uncharacterized protein n=1 Tax=Arundo donax TaxID=35708 RepID=A0A0A9CHV9_ARUDO
MLCNERTGNLYKWLFSQRVRLSLSVGFNLYRCNKPSRIAKLLHYPMFINDSMPMKHLKITLHEPESV